MPRGNEQKIFWPIRQGEEEADEAEMNGYLQTLKSTKENKGVNFYIKRDMKNEKGIKGHYIVLLEKKAEEDEAKAKGFSKHS